MAKVKSKGEFPVSQKDSAQQSTGAQTGEKPDDLVKLYLKEFVKVAEDVHEGLPEKVDQEWKIEPHADFTLSCIKVADEAFRLRGLLMPQVVRQVHSLVGEFKDLSTYVDVTNHWDLERSLELKPHFEHSLLVISREEKEELNPRGVDLVWVLLTAQTHWNDILTKAETIKIRLQVPCPASVKLNQEDFANICQALLYNRRPYSRPDSEEFSGVFKKFVADWGKYLEPGCMRAVVDPELVPGMVDALIENQLKMEAPIGTTYSYIESVVTAKENFWTTEGRIEAMDSFCFKVQSQMLRWMSSHRVGFNAAFSHLQWHPRSKDYTLEFMEPYGPKNLTNFVPAGVLVTWNPGDDHIVWDGRAIPGVPYEHQGGLTSFAEIGTTPIEKFKFGQAKAAIGAQSAPIEEFRELQKYMTEKLDIKNSRCLRVLQKQNKQNNETEMRAAVKKQLADKVLRLFKGPLYTNRLEAKNFRASQFLRGQVDHLEVKETNMDSCLPLATNLCGGTVVYNSIDDMLTHFAKIDGDFGSPSVEFRRLMFTADRGTRIPARMPAIPFIDYPEEPILLSFNPLHTFSRQELCNLARHPMLLALLLSSISSTRAMLQMTKPPWQPPGYRTSHVIAILWNWLRRNWAIRDSGDRKWYDVVSFTQNGEYIEDCAHIYNLLAPLEGLVLWTFHYEPKGNQPSTAMAKLFQTLGIRVKEGTDPSLRRLTVGQGMFDWSFEANAVAKEPLIKFECEQGQEEDFKFAEYAGVPEKTVPAKICGEYVYASDKFLQAGKRMKQAKPSKHQSTEDQELLPGKLLHKYFKKHHRFEASILASDGVTLEERSSSEVSSS